MRVVSTAAKKGWDVYGRRWLDGIQYWPDDTEFYLYPEGFEVDHPRVATKSVHDLPRAVTFKAKYGHYVPLTWQWDIIRFSNKVFAAYDALYDYDGLGVWLDADAITYAPLPDGYIASLLPKGAYLALFKRSGMEPETGFWVMDCSHPAHKRFLDKWVGALESGYFTELVQWCDASTLAVTIRQMEKANLVRTVSLSGEYAKEQHPMAKVDLARYIDHLKGGRKEMNASPENAFRAA